MKKELTNFDCKSFIAALLPLYQLIMCKLSYKKWSLSQKSTMTMALLTLVKVTTTLPFLSLLMFLQNIHDGVVSERTLASNIHYELASVPAG